MIFNLLLGALACSSVSNTENGKATIKPDKRELMNSSVAVPMLAAKLVEEGLCVGFVLPFGLVNDVDELAPGGPLYGVDYGPPGLQTTSGQRQAIYKETLFPLISELERVVPVCSQDAKKTKVNVELGFSTLTADRSVGKAIARIVTHTPYRECRSVVPVVSMPILSLEKALYELTEILANCVQKEW